MASPFPGMNPYLEQDTVWSDFHHGFCSVLKRALVPLVQPACFVKIDEHIYIHEEGERELIGRADVAFTRRHRDASNGSTSAVLDAPVIVQVSGAPFEERVPYVEIFDKRLRQVVTLIELLSPANKRKGSDREQFLGKRRQVLGSEVNYVEIDLLRGGPRLPIDDMPACDYYVLISPADDRPEMGFWPIGLRETLPTIPIPVPRLKRRVRIDLQTLLHQAYDEAGYGSYIYDGSPQPPLRKEDARWAKRVLRTES